MRQPRPDYMEYPDLLHQIESGIIKIPDFQREVVWDIGQTLYLLDSISRGFPIGSFIFWQTRERMKAHKSVGNLPLREPDDANLISYVLDGQQRLTSLYACIKGATIGSRKYQVFCDLDSSDEDDVFQLTCPDESRFVDISDLLGDNPQFIYKTLTDVRQKRFDSLRESFRLYKFPTIRIEDQPLDVVCEIFTRINNTGTELDLFDLMVAKTWTEDFNLREKYFELSSSLEEVKFEGVSASVVMQMAACIIKNGCTRKLTLSILRDEIVERWDAISKSVWLAVDFVRNNLNVPSSRLLPYQSLLVPISYFYYHNGFKQPDALQAHLLSRYFWRASAIERYTSATESKLGQDIKEVDKLLSGEGDEATTFAYSDGWVAFNDRRLIRTPLSLGNAFCKMVLAFLASNNPLSLENNALVRVDNSSLSRSNSRHFHHFFPKGHLRKKGISQEYANSVINICIIPAESNLHYQDKAPREYLAELNKTNPNLSTALRAHFIDEYSEFGVNFGIKEDDYSKFLEERAERIEGQLASLVWTNQEFDDMYADGYDQTDDDND